MSALRVNMVMLFTLNQIGICASLHQYRMALNPGKRPMLEELPWNVLLKEFLLITNANVRSNKH